MFVGASDLAQRWWCAQYSLLAARDEELMFFANYLYNGVEYAGLLRAEPQAGPACQLAKQTRGAGESGELTRLLKAVEGAYKTGLDRVLRETLGEGERARRLCRIPCRENRQPHLHVNQVGR